ncbi:uncharacterized protein [Pyrus communis]|uniref:uncharacterized protein n=1 Tax=Pyrus communis TaxID=23211 RepID=UPI0035BED6A8
MVMYFKVFGSVCYILCDLEHLAKFDTKSDEGIFLGYFNTSQAYRVFNMRTETIMESINVKIDDTDFPPSLAIENDDMLFPSSRNNGDASGESSVVLESDNESELSIEQDPCVLFKASELEDKLLMKLQMFAMSPRLSLRISNML